MLLSFDGKINKIGYKDFCNSKFSVAIISADEFSNRFSQLGISTREYIYFNSSDNGFRNSVTITSESYIFPFKMIANDYNNRTESHVCFFIRKNSLIAVIIKDDNAIFRSIFTETIGEFENETASSEKITSRLFDKLTRNDGKMNEQTELAINKLEENISEDENNTDINEQILLYNKKLMSLRNYYEQLINIGERLYENENGIFDNQKTYNFKAISDRANRLCAEINLLRENLVRLREAYQARIDLKMNSTMKLLTVITVIFLPLTLITGWYGMNFIGMKELTSPYGYPTVITVSIAVVVLCIIIFKKKKIL